MRKGCWLILVVAALLLGVGPVGCGELRLADDVKLELVRVEAGTFMMGSPASEEGRFYTETQHRVTLTRDFYLGKTEVTQAQWRAVMGSNPSYFKGDDRPVERVS